MTLTAPLFDWDRPVELALKGKAEPVVALAVIPIAYARNVYLVQPRVHGWWEYGKSWASFANLVVDEP